MKQFLVAITLLSVTLSSCKKEETPDPTPSNTLTIKGSESAIVFGEMIDYGKDIQNTNNYYFELMLATGAVSATYEPIWEYSGKGNVLRFSLFSGSPNIATSTYTVDETWDKNLVIYETEASFNEDFDKEFTEWSSRLAGTIHINNLGDRKYEITVDLTDEDGNLVTAYYNGVLNYVVGS